MNQVRYTLSNFDDFQVVEFEIVGGVLSPDELEGAIAALPEIDPRKGVVFSGRGPIWFYVALAHSAHGALWAATYEPRLGGAIVAMSHGGRKKVGELIPVSLPYQR